MIRGQEDPRLVKELIAAAILEIKKNEEAESETGSRAVSTLHARGTWEVLGAGRALCRSLDPERRELGALILGQLGSPERTFPEECCDALLALLEDAELGVVRSALFALGHLRNRRCEPDLLAFKNHPDDQVRHGVAYALVGSERPESVQALLELMDDPFELARDWATTSIGQMPQIDGPEIREALLKRATDPDTITRAEALNGLALRRDTRTESFLIVELEAKHEELRYLFENAARVFLGIGEDIETDELLQLLRANVLQEKSKSSDQNITEEKLIN